MGQRYCARVTTLRRATPDLRQLSWISGRCPCRRPTRNPALAEHLDVDQEHPEQHGEREQRDERHPAARVEIAVQLLQKIARLVHDCPHAAACLMIAATAFGWETIVTCEAPLSTTVSLEPARSAMNFIAAGAMALSAS